MSLPEFVVGSRTLRTGMTGTDVLALQQVLNREGARLTEDGNYGPGSTAALKEWQERNKLVPDGVVGPATWAALGVKTTGKPVVSSKAAENDRWAYEVAKRAAPNMSETERQYVLAVARGEGHYGLGWATPSASTVELSKRFGLRGDEGAGSNNWGAVQGSGSAGSFQHVDVHADGKAYLGTFKRYASPEEGFVSMAKIILGGGPIRKAVGAAAISDALSRGNLRDAVFAQHANKYFELNPEKYLLAVSKNFEALSESTGWKKRLSALGDFVVEHAGGLQKGIAIAAGAIITGLISLFLLKRKKS